MATINPLTSTLSSQTNQTSRQDQNPQTETDSKACDIGKKRFREESDSELLNPSEELVTGEEPPAKRPRRDLQDTFFARRFDLLGQSLFNTGEDSLSPRVSPRTSPPRSPSRTSPPRGYRVAPPRRARGPIKTKEPIIIDNHLIIRENKYPLRLIGEGKFHRVYEFQCSSTITHQGQSIKLDEVIIRTRNPKAGVVNAQRITQLDDQAFKYCEENGIPIPCIFLHPDQFSDPTNPKNGGFWLIEKMDKAVSIEGWKNGQKFEELPTADQTVLTFVRNWLTKNYNEKREVIADLHPGNLMWDKEGNLKVVDPSLPNNEDWAMHLKGLIKKWSNGNESIQTFLTKEMDFYSIE